MRLFVLLLFSLFIFTSQANNKDELLKQLETAKGSQKADVLFELADIYIDEDYEKAME
jgi:hypothetical protein